MGIEEKYATAIEVLKEDSSFSNGVYFGKFDKEIVKFKEAISYLKDYSKLQLMAKLVAENTNLKDSLSNLKPDIEQSIAQYTYELQNVPKVTIVRPRAGLIGQYKALEQSLCKRKNDTMRAQRAQKISEIKQKIAEAKARLKAIKEIEKLVSTPKRAQNRFLQKQENAIDSKYNSLLSYCYDALNSGFLNSNYLQTSGIFIKNDDGTLSLDEKKAKSLISVSKNQKSVTKLAEFIKAKQEISNTRLEYRENLRKMTDLMDFDAFSENYEMKLVFDKMNSISKEYFELCKMEEKARKGNVFTRTLSFIKRSLNMDDSTKIPKSVIEKRVEVSKLMKNICHEIESNPKLNNAFCIFSKARSILSGDNNLDLNRLKEIANMIPEYGDKFGVLRRTYDIGDMRFDTKALQVKKEENKEELAIKLKQAKEKKTELYNKLSKRDLQILEKYGEEGISYVAGMFYPEETGMSFVGNRKDKIVPSTAISILEGIVNRRKVDFASCMDTYARVYGEEAREEEIKGMNASLYDIIESIKNTASEIVTHKPTIAQVPNKPLISKPTGIDRD